MNPRYSLMFFLSGALTVCLGGPAEQGSATGEPYLPQIKVWTDWTDADGVSHKDIAYRFSEAQLAAMARTKLDAQRVRLYVERTWPIERLRALCVPTNVFPRDAQNLVALRRPVETEIHNAHAAGFDRIWVYVAEDDGRDTYIGKTGTEWHRWKYSLNAKRGLNYWVIIWPLPNDLMDSPEYKASELNGAANRSQPSRTETNRTSAAAGSGR